MIIEAIQKAGLNRALIRDVLTDMKTFQGYEGVSGKMVFDGTWNNVRPSILQRSIMVNSNFLLLLLIKGKCNRQLTGKLNHIKTDSNGNENQQ